MYAMRCIYIFEICNDAYGSLAWNLNKLHFMFLQPKLILINNAIRVFIVDYRSTNSCNVTILHIMHYSLEMIFQLQFIRHSTVRRLQLQVTLQLYFQSLSWFTYSNIIYYKTSPANLFRLLWVVWQTKGDEFTIYDK